MTPKNLVTLCDAAEATRVSTRTIRRWVADGLLPACRVGPKLLRVDLTDVEALMRRVPSAATR